MSGAEEERWHVRLAPGEIKLLTLEQIDDLFRLEMIDGDTLLRQEGTEDWQRLRVVAGLEDDAPAPTAAPEPVRSAPPPPSHRAPAPQSAPPAPVRSAPSAPPPPVRSAPPSPTAPPPPSAQPPTVTSARPPAVSGAPPPPPTPLPPPREAAPFAHSPSFAPPAVSSRAPVHRAPPPPPPPSAAPSALSAHPPSYSTPPSIVPSYAPPAVASIAPLSVTPPALAARPSRLESTLIGVAALVGLLIALHRNGVVAALFASAGQSAAYAKLETALGGPGSGTPRAVQALIEPAGAEAKPKASSAGGLAR
jgi:hypothetical protein